MAGLASGLGLGLVSYASSDEESEVEEKQEVKVGVDVQVPTAELARISHKVSNEVEEERTQPTATVAPQIGPEAPIVGPVLGPSGPDTSIPTLPDDVDDDGPPRSPYSANRALLRDLTMPPVPNFDIPPSPPGSPPPATEKKFAQFLQLKKQGQHLNEKLARSTALKNPSLMEKLMDFADISEEEQYATTLPRDIWDPSAFPNWAYKEELAKSQQQILKRREEEKLGGPREFVPAAMSGESSRAGTPGIASRGGPKSAAERVMAGLDRGRSGSPQVAGVKRKTRFDS